MDGIRLRAGFHRAAAWVRDRLAGLPSGCRSEGTEVVLTGGYDTLPGFLGWEARTLTQTLELAFARVGDARAWLAANARGRWTCTMPANGLDAAWSVPPGMQSFRLADPHDAEGFARAFPDARRLVRA